MTAILDEAGLAILDENSLAILDEELGVSNPYEAPPPEWTIYVRDVNGTRVAQLDAFEKATMVLRHNGVGSWSLSAPASAPATLVTNAGSGLEFVRNGAVIMTGPVVARVRRFDASFDGWDFTGVDDVVWLARRLASPEPDVAVPPYDGQDYDVRTGPASSVIHAYVDANVGTAAVAARRVTGFTVGTDPVVGTTVTGRARWQTVLDLCAALADAGGIGFRVVDLTFGAYALVDRSAAVQFSVDLGNLAAFSYASAAPEFNHIVVAGGGAGVARVVVEVSDSTSVSGWGRIESFRDRRDTTDTTEMTQTANGDLAENASKIGLALTPIDTGSVRFGDHYNLGDVVTVIVDGVAIVDTVREVTIELTGAGESVRPLIGNPEASPHRPRLFGLAARLNRQIRDLQRSQ